MGSRVHARGKGAPKKKREAPSRSSPQHIRKKLLANLWDSRTAREEEEVRRCLRRRPCTIAIRRTIDAPNICMHSWNFRNSDCWRLRASMGVPGDHVPLLDVQLTTWTASCPRYTLSATHPVMFVGCRFPNGPTEWALQCRAWEMNVFRCLIVETVSSALEIPSHSHMRAALACLVNHSTGR